MGYTQSMRIGVVFPGIFPSFCNCEQQIDAYKLAIDFSRRISIDHNNSIVTVKIRAII